MTVKQFFLIKQDFSQTHKKDVDYFLNVFQNNTVYIATETYEYNINSLKMRQIALRKNFIENFLKNN